MKGWGKKVVEGKTNRKNVEAIDGGRGKIRREGRSRDKGSAT